MIKSLLHLFFPEVCLGCKSTLLASEDTICTICRHQIPLTNHVLNQDNEAFNKFYGKIPVEFVATLCYYHKRGVVQELIHGLKYKGHESVGNVFGNWMAEDLKPVSKTHNFGIIVPVPLHKKRLKERGYNQVTAFATAIANELDIPCNENILKRNLYSKSQVNKNLLNRIDIKESLFEAVFDETFHNTHFLLVDDVLTTGATLEACSRALLKIPGAKISVVCIAMSHS